MTTHTETHTESRAGRLERSRSDRKLAGVAGGLARYFNLDPVIYRVGFIVLTLLGGSGILVYIAAALVIPDEGKEDSIAAEIIGNRRERPWALIGLGLLVIAGCVLLGNTDVWPDGSGIWLVLALIGGVIVWRQSRGEPRPHRWLRVTLGLLAALVVAAVAATAVAAFSVGHVTHGVGERVYHVSSADALQSKYHLGTGRIELDLRNAQLDPGTNRVAIDLGVGEVRVIPPAGTTVRYRADVDAGNIVVNGSERRNGWHIDSAGTVSTVPDAPILVVDAHVGVGTFQLERVLR